LIISQIFLNHVVSTHFSSSYNQIIFLTARHFEYWLHQGLWNAYFYLFLSSSLHMRLHLRALFTKPMFRVNKPLLKILWWHSGIFHDMSSNILPHHLKFATWKMDIPKNSMTWHGIFLKILHVHVSLHTCSPASVVVKFIKSTTQD